MRKLKCVIESKSGWIVYSVIMFGLPIKFLRKMCRYFIKNELLSFNFCINFYVNLRKILRTNYLLNF